MTPLFHLTFFIFLPAVMALALHTYDKERS